MTMNDVKHIKQIYKSFKAIKNENFSLTTNTLLCNIKVNQDQLQSFFYEKSRKLL
jgi:hypothetical protein